MIHSSTNEVFRTAVDEHLDKLAELYQSDGRARQFSFRQFCRQWVKRSDVYTHMIHRYPAKLLPYIPIFFLTSTRTSPKHGLLVDPFAGTGTVLLEAMVHDSNPMNALGVEINSLVRLIAKVKTTPLNVSDLHEATNYLKNKILADGKSRGIPEFPFRDYWFVEEVQRGLARIRYWIDQLSDLDLRDFFWVCLSATIRKVSLADPSIAPAVKINPSRFKGLHKERMKSLLRQKLNADASQEFFAIVKKNSLRMKTLLNRLDQVSSYHTPSIIWDDARTLRKGRYVEKGTIDKTAAEDLSQVDLVITSPPYVNAQKYLRTLRLEMYWLGLLSPTELSEVDSKYIGTERIYFPEYSKPPDALGIATADKLIRRVYRKDNYRATILACYLRDMQKVVKNTFSILKPGGHLVMIVGNNSMRGVVIKNHQILLEMCRMEGAKDICVILDRIRSRGMITKRHETAGIIPSEWVIVAQKPVS